MGAKSPKRMDLKDDVGNHLFERLVKKHGVLNEDEMYGFKHRLSLGGAEDLNNMGIMKLKVYHDIAMQVEPPRVLIL